MTIEADIENIQQLQKEASESEATKSQKESKLRDKIRTLADKIKAGKYTTRDSVKDFAIYSTCELESPDLERKLYSLQELVAKNQNQPVLVVHESEEPLRRYIVPPKEDSPTFTRRELVLGVINDKLRFEYESKIENCFGFLFGPNKIIIPTGKYARKSDGSNRWSVIDNSIAIPCSAIEYHRASDPSASVSGDLSIGARFNAFFGEEVTMYFSLRNISVPLIADLREGKISKESLQKQIDEWNDFDTDYVKALDLLGKPELVPQVFRQRYDSEILESRTKVLSQLQTLSIASNFGSKMEEALRDAQALGMNELDQAIEGIHIRTYVNFLEKKYQSNNKNDC
jgi:hypothetical protein